MKLQQVSDFSGGAMVVWVPSQQTWLTDPKFGAGDTGAMRKSLCMWMSEVGGVNFLTDA